MIVPSAPVGQMFYFLRSIVVVFDTHVRVDHPHDLGAAVGAMSTGSIFYHFIDARRRTAGGLDEFRAWLELWGGEFDELRMRLAGIDPYFDALPALRQRLSRLIDACTEGAS